MFPAPFTRRKSGTIRTGDGRAPSTVGKSVHSARPTLETLEARLLLSGDAEFAVQYPIPSPASAYTRVLLPSGETAMVGAGQSWDESGKPIALVPIGVGGSVASSGYRAGGGAMMSVYDEADADHLYQMKTMNLSSTDAMEASPIGSSIKPLIFSTSPAATARMVGMVDPPPDSTSFRIPVGPEVGGLRLGVTPWGHLAFSNIPFIDDLTLYDSAGKKLSEMSAHWDSEHFPSPSLLVSLANVPVGSQLVLRISASAAASLQQTLGADQSWWAASLGSTETGYSGSSGSTPFVLSVEEFINLSSQGGSTSGANQIRGDVDFSSANLTVGYYGLSTTKATGSASEGETSTLGSSTNTSDQAANVRIPTGPLIARGATPMGGILANAVIEDDPAPAIERFDGILTAFLNGLDGDEDRLADEGFFETEESIIAPEDPGNFRKDIVIAGTTPGNLPLVSSSPIGPRDADQSAALLASLPSLDVEVPATAPDAPPLEIGLLADPKKSEEPGLRIGSWASAAFGLTIGLTLTSGTYLPDILTRLRKASTRKPGRRKPRRKS